MQTETIQEAVQSTVAEFMDKGKSFSAYEITLEIRRKVNDRQLDISDVDRNDFGKGRVSDVEHHDVRGRVQTIIDYSPEYEKSFNGQYVLYVPKQKAAPPALPSYSVVGKSVQSNTPKTQLNPNDADVQKRVRNYLLKNKNQATVKRVQSTLRRQGSISSDNVKEVCRKLGYYNFSGGTAATTKIS
jgi:hypothetical protein